MRLSLPCLLLSLTLALGAGAHADDGPAVKASGQPDKTVLKPQLAETSDAADLVDDILAKAADKVILNGYRSFASASGTLKTAMDALCAAPSEAHLQEAQKAFSGLVLSWSTVENIKTGPVLQDNRAERILFYPDKTGSGLKQITALLAAKDETLLSADKLSEKSVGVQGLGALEYSLFGTGFEDLQSANGAFRCRYGLTVATGLGTLADELSSIWSKDDGIRHDFKHPSPANTLFQNDKQAITAVLGTLVHGLDAIRKQRISAFYTGKDAASTPKKAIFWRSGNTMPSIAANLQGLSDLWTQSDMKTLLKGDATAYGGNIEFNFKTAISAAKAVTLPIDQAVSDDKQRAKLDFLILTIGDLYKLMSEDVGKAIGLGAGFSFSDGD